MSPFEISRCESPPRHAVDAAKVVSCDQQRVDHNDGNARCPGGWGKRTLLNGYIYNKQFQYMGVEPKIGGVSPKMDGENSGKPY